MSNSLWGDDTSNFVVETPNATAEEVAEVQTPEVEPTVEAESTPTEAVEETQEIEAEATETEQEEGAEEFGESNDDETTAEQDHPKKESGVQKRFNKLTRQREEAKREAEALKAELDKLKAEREAQANAKPDEDDFDDYESYLDAEDAWKAKTKELRETRQDTGQDDGLTAEQRTAYAVVQEATKDASERFEDYEEVMNTEGLAISPQMLEHMQYADDPAKVAYLLGKNPKLSQEIANMPSHQQAREIAKLDMQVKAKPPKPVQKSKASKPISKVAGTQVQQKSIGEMSFAEYNAYMNKKDAERRKSSW